MDKFFIKNRRGRKIAVLLEKHKDQKGLVFVTHGLGGFKEQPHITTFALAFKEKKFTVVRFDNGHSLGESYGDYNKANFTNYYNDLVDVINWSKKNKWYQEPFALASHSMGSGCILYYAAHHPKKVKAPAPTATVIGGKYSLQHYKPEDLTKWEESGLREELSKSKGIVKKLNWPQFKKDILKYDILILAHKLTMPVLLMVGSKDTGTPLADQKKLYSKLKGDKELHVIKGSTHTFKEKKHLEQIKKIFKNWISKKVLK
ncbi:MAG: alpha/beta fold hydrolase [Patescibacteria group bacterium]|nr:alpha/beta fold hydrolase [Patescibacteria group bacterium]